MLIALAIPVILLAASLGGALRFRHCWRGLPVDQHPVCRRCRYDLIGSPKPYSTCPECGADLTARKATAIGNRKRKPGHALVAGFISLISTALLATILLNVATRINFNPHKPFWLLQLEATTPSLNSDGHELDELLIRTKKGSLSASQLDSLMDSVLQEQANTAIPWDETWGDLFAELFTQGVGTQAQHDQFAHNIYTFNFEPRPRVRLGDRIPLSSPCHYNRGHGDSTWYYRVNTSKHVSIDKLSKQLGLTGMSGATKSSGRFGTSVRTDHAPFDELTVGTHTITYDQEIEIRIASRTGPLVGRLNTTHSNPIEILHHDANDITLYSDPQEAIAIEAGITIRHNRIDLRPQRNNPERFFADIQINLTSTNVPFGYQVIGSANGQEWNLTTIADSGPTNNHGWGFRLDWPPDLDTDHIDLIFRPDPDAARSTTDVYRIIDHEFTLKDVEVVRQP